MRGRSLLKETSSPSLCAYCANRLGQSRRPSQLCRRFIHSSRPVSNPPAEATAVRERDDDGRPAQSAWAFPRGSGLGPVSSSWGRAPGNGGISSASSGANWASAHGNRTSQSSIPAGSSNYTAELLPHEQRARDIMLEKERAAHRRPLNMHFGAGPNSNRAGRDQPWTKEERLERANAERSRARALDTHLEQKRDREMASFAGTRSIFAEPTTGTESPPPWSQLRKKAEATPPKTSARSENRFAEGRAEREEQAKFARYTPLGRTPPYRRKEDGINTTQTANFESEKGSIARSAGNSNYEGGKRHLARETMFSNMTPFEMRSEENSIVPSSTTTKDERYPLLRSTSVPEKSTSTEQIKSDVAPASEEQEDTSERKKKTKKRRGQVETSYHDVSKGKDRDKGKRRQQFIRNDGDDASFEEAAAKAEEKRLRKEEKAARKKAEAAAPTPILLPEFISVQHLAIALRVKFEPFVEKMEELGFEETSHDHILNAENAGLIAMEYNYEPIIDRGESQDLKAREPPADPSILPPRPPVITIMGHVDHGKTTLLDWLRKSSVAATEHGGITQHIGAFSVPMPSGKLITFLDTPGHAAFLSMRQRGANVTDIVVLVVAADDSVKPQTIEAINHAKAAGVPMIVAINKIDKDESNVEKVKQDLARHGVEVEDYGGDTQTVCVSGKTGQGMGELEEAVVTLSEILDMRSEIDGPAEGWVIEASIKSMGKVATVLVRRGTMRPGDFIVAGKTWARIRCLRNEAGVEIEEAGPGTPVEIDGWREQPLAGDEVLQAADESKAKSVIDYRLEKVERDRMAEDMEAVNEFRKSEQEKRDREKAEALAIAQAKEGREDLPEFAKETKVVGPKQVYFIIKGDVSGSVEAVIDSISQLGNKEVQPHILRSGVGQLSEFDIEHAASAKGHLINFNTPVEQNILNLAKASKVNVLDHNIIYRLVDDVKVELSKHLPPLITYKVLGEADIAQVFEITVKGRQQKSIAGCKVRNGTISRNDKVRVMRDGEKIFDGTLASLKNVKKDVQEMKRGGECGIGFTDWFDFKVGDAIQAYQEIHEKRYL